jgi:hypothetical protein
MHADFTEMHVLSVQAEAQGQRVQRREAFLGGLGGKEPDREQDRSNQCDREWVWQERYSGINTFDLLSSVDSSSIQQKNERYARKHIGFLSKTPYVYGCGQLNTQVCWPVLAVQCCGQCGSVAVLASSTQKKRMLLDKVTQRRALAGHLLGRLRKKQEGPKSPVMLYRIAAPRGYVMNCCMCCKDPHFGGNNELLHVQQGSTFWG